ncbi:hypothetical protein F5884DRAFT_663240 [Xylogone sp. PMI_703]|nr:hypothetical protein F5884DRAFT_663240 [Xylogone sp. PMI_703]
MHAHHNEKGATTTAQAVRPELPIRQPSNMSAASDDAVPITNPMNTPDLLQERLQAWKHAVGYLEEYIGATQKLHHAHSKEYEKVLKTVQSPLREGHHFDQNLGGVAGLFENIRQNTQGIINSHLETEKNIKGSVLPILDRLHKEIKAKAKELEGGIGKTAKEVEKSRNTTQKHIELLGTHTAGFDSSAHKLNAHDDPYVIRRGVIHRLNKQLMEENNHRRDILAVQNNFETFEAHVLEVIQQSLASFNQFVGAQAQKTGLSYADMLATAQRIPPEFEWINFMSRSADKLIDPSTPDRTLDSVSFPNENHKSTKPLIEGTLERKSRNKLSMAGFTSAYYVVTPSKFLHEFKDTDNFRHDPVPQLSIYLPDAVVGAVSGDKFNIKGKDLSGGMGAKLSGSSELSFKARSPADAQKWHDIIMKANAAPVPAINTGVATNGSSGSAPVSAITPTSAGGTGQTTGVAPGVAPAAVPAAAGEKETK